MRGVVLSSLIVSQPRSPVRVPSPKYEIEDEEEEEEEDWADEVGDIEWHRI